MEYDVFISYRRAGGEYTAKIIKDELTNRGYNVFFDVESLRSGNFNTKLYSVIENAKDFILVLAPESLKRCDDENDWVRLEIECALKNDLNIIPILLKDFSFPKDLPESIDEIRYKSGIEANTEFFDAFMDKLSEFLVTKPSLKTRIFKKRNPRKVLSSAACIVAAVALTAGIIFGTQALKKNGDNDTTTVPKTTMSAEQKNLTEDVFAYILRSLSSCENLVRAAENTVVQAENCLGASDIIAFNDLYSKADTASLAVQKCCEEPVTLGDDVLNQLYSSELFIKADLTMLPTDIAANAEMIQGDINYLLNILDSKCPLSLSQKRESISIVKENLEIFKDYIKYVVNILIINVDKDYAATFRNGCSTTYINLGFENYTWVYDLEELESKIEANLNRQEELLNRLSALVGETNYQVMVMAADFYAQQNETSTTAQNVSATKQTLQELSEAQSKVDKLEAELESKRAEVRKKFAPDSTMDAELLWAYMGRNLMAGIYDQALTCLEMYDGKTDSSESDIYIPIMRQYIKAVESGKVEAYGLMVFGYSPDEQHDFYEIGDIVISIDGKKLETIDDYNSDNPDAEIAVLRMNANGEFEKKTFILSEHSKAPVLLCPVLS